ncbi:MAG TPA: hypothetical protein VHF67_11425 [Gaiellaceae bacterium]|nr:hypothetical protein [Gaiellaceae bacterium]
MKTALLAAVRARGRRRDEAHSLVEEARALSPSAGSSTRRRYFGCTRDGEPFGIDDLEAAHVFIDAPTSRP